MQRPISSLVVVLLGALAGIVTVAVVSLVLYQHITESTVERASATAGDAEPGAEEAPEYDPLAAAVEELGFQALRDEVIAEEFELDNLTGETETLSSYSGQLVLLNFWATWCPPCVEEMPSLQNLHTDLEDDAFSVVAVNVQEDRETVNEFVQELGLRFPVLLDRNGKTTRRYAVRGMPTSYLISPDGRVIGAKIGFHIWDEPGYTDGFRRVLELSS